ncbi:MAG: hypothetical protein ACI35S_03220 [Anaeroplasma sp.]
MDLKKKKSKPIKIEDTSLAAPKKIKVLVSIVERPKADFYISVLEGYDVNMQAVLYAKGTAPTDILHYLGLNGSDKAVILSIVKEERVQEILNAYEDKYFKTKNGRGIAFTIPISSVIGVMVYQFLANINVR